MKVRETRQAEKKKVQHHVRHQILTKGPPVADRPRRLSPGRRKCAQQEIDKWIQTGDCRPGKGQWTSAMHLVKKKSEGYRICGDYRRLNKITIPDRYPIPHLQDFAHKLQDCAIFITLDLTRTYHQIPMAEDKEKTAIITPFGLYEYNSMPFGLRNAAQTFQRTIEEQKQHLREVFQRLKEYGLTNNLEKSTFGQKEV
ncbi:gag pol polyprotein [Lasius niger]|uniref:Gag pol polyprotein n=1 Tax=Lasius niger TaxID=67767 RepID=A0A0J7MZF3_LASNI|nr:gag pol polyprotein [Lasius niger]